MKAKASWAQQWNQVLQRIYALSAEMQILLCILFWMLIAVVLLSFNIQEGANTTLLVWVPLLLLLNGLISGLIVAVLGALLCTLVLSPFGPLDKIPLATDELIPISIVFIIGAMFGGILKRLIIELNQRLESAQFSVQGTDLPNHQAAVKHLDVLLKSKELKGKELEVLNVQLENLEQIRLSAGQERTDQLVKEFADILKDKLGSESHVSQSAASELLGILVSRDDKPLELEALLKSVTAEAASRNEDPTHNISSKGTVRRHPVQEEGAQKGASQLLDKAREQPVEPPAPIVPPPSPVPVTRQAPPPVEDVGYFLGKTLACQKVQAGIKKGEIVIEYVPRLNVSNGYFSALEAVIIWHHPQRGELSISEIMVMLDDPMAVPRLNRWLLEQVLEDAGQWFEQGHRFAVTIKGALDGHISTALIEKALLGMKQYPANTAWLSLEFAEVSLSKAGPKAIEALRYIQQYGGAVIVSSYQGSTIALSQIFQLPVDSVKLSPRLLDNATSDDEQRRELGSTIKLIHSRGLTVIADGIENSAVIRMLRPYGCDELLGPFLSRPISRAQIPWGRIRA